MSDIVERLLVAGHNALMDDAAHEIERLRAALKPFANVLEMLECTTSHKYSDDDLWDVPIGDLRRARATLTAAR